MIETRVNCGDRRRGDGVPTLFRFIVILAILGGIGYGAMWGLVTFVEPEPREMTSTISPMRFAPQR